jgi:hypothetical protein
MKRRIVKLSYLWTYVWTYLSTLVLMVGSNPTLGASVQGAVVTRTEGEAQLMIKQSNLNGKPQAELKSIIFEKETYFMRPVKNGDRPANGDVVTTGKDGKVRLIYRNGDQVTVTPGTAFKFSWDPKTDRNAVAELVYGDIRAVIQPEGPRSGMKVNTKTAVLGVRGTDFYVSSWTKESGSRVAVMRGAVALAPKVVTSATPSTTPVQLKDGKVSTPKQAQTPKVQEVIVAAGSSGTVTKKPMIPAENLALTEAAAPIVAPIVAVQATSKQELVVIQADSKVAKPKVEEIAKSSDPVAKEIAKLEAASVETTLNDVKRHDPELYAKLQEETKKGHQLLDADHVQAETVKKIFVTAPSVVNEPHKPTLEDLDTGGDIYDKYKWEKN